MLTLPCIIPVAGVSFHQDEVVLLEENQPILVRHNPENPYDANACEVLTISGELIGHAPAVLAAQLVEIGDRFAASIHAVLRGETFGIRLKIVRPLAPDFKVKGARGAAALRQTENGVVSDAPVENEVHVFLKSGRLLGALLKQGEGTVQVKSKDGVSLYPEGLVEVRAS